MTISKKILMSSTLACMVTFISAVSMKGFDPSLLNPFLVQAQNALDNTAQELENKINKGAGLHWRDSYTDLLYPLQRAALKAFVKQLKYAAVSLKDGDQTMYKTARQLHKAFKHTVYKSWKKTRIIPATINATQIGYPKQSLLMLE